MPAETPPQTPQREAKRGRGGGALGREGRREGPWTARRCPTVGRYVPIGLQKVNRAAATPTYTRCRGGSLHWSGKDCRGPKGLSGEGAVHKIGVRYVSICFKALPGAHVPLPDSPFGHLKMDDSSPKVIPAPDFRISLWKKTLRTQGNEE